MFMYHLKNIHDDLNNHKRDRYTMFLSCVENRLEQSFNSYFHDIILSETNLSNKNAMSVLKMHSRGKR